MVGSSYVFSAVPTANVTSARASDFDKLPLALGGR